VCVIERERERKRERARESHSESISRAQTYPRTRQARCPPSPPAAEQRFSQARFSQAHCPSQARFSQARCPPSPPAAEQRFSLAKPLKPAERGGLASEALTRRLQPSGSPPCRALLRACLAKPPLQVQEASLAS
jgi:hypothetical protein